MSELVQFTSVHFADQNPNFYGNLKNMKFDLNISTKQGIHSHEIIRSTVNQYVYTHTPTT